MAEFITKCPHCSKELQAQDKWIGMEVECPLCRNMFAINKSSAQVETEKTEAVINFSLAADEKSCPFCGGVIKEQAVFCKHCKTDLNKTIAQEQKQVESLFIFICPECDTVAELPEVLKDKEYECQCCCETSIAREAIERNCPSCGEKIKIKATVCKHCKQSVQPLLNCPVSMPGNSENKGISKLLPVANSNTGIFKYSNASSIVVSILWGLSTIAWIVSLICIFVDGLAWFIAFALGLVLSGLALALKKDEKFELQENEVVLSNCRLRDENNLSYYVRMTNQRLVLSAVEYPLLPWFVVIIIEILAKPNRVTFAWNWSDIKNITRENKKILGFDSWKNVIEDFQEKHTFCANKKLEEFWNYRMWEW